MSNFAKRPTQPWEPPAAWVRWTLDDYVFYLIGAVSNVMLPPTQVMPSEEILRIKAQVDAMGPIEYASERIGRMEYEPEGDF